MEIKNWEELKDFIGQLNAEKLKEQPTLLADALCLWQATKDKVDNDMNQIMPK